MFWKSDFAAKETRPDYFNALYMLTLANKYLGMNNKTTTMRVIVMLFIYKTTHTRWLNLGGYHLSAGVICTTFDCLRLA